MEAIVSQLHSLKSAFVCAHVAPDADAIGSAGALTLALRAHGCEAVMLLEEEMPVKLAALASAVPCEIGVPEREVDALITVDTATAARVAVPIESLRPKVKQIINIDHHISNTEYGDHNLVIADSAASAVIILDLCRQASFEITPTVASLLYMGLIDDTGCFRFSNTDAASLRAAAELVDAGASVSDIANALYFSMPLQELKVRAAALSHIEVVLDGKLAFLAVSREMLEQAGASADDTEGIVDYARSVAGTQVAAFARELSDGWKISLRSKDESIDVQAVAQQFGGGGHRMAAGAKMRGDLASVKEQLFSALQAVVR